MNTERPKVGMTYEQREAETSKELHRTIAEIEAKLDQKTRAKALLNEKVWTPLQIPGLRKIDSATIHYKDGGIAEIYISGGGLYSNIIINTQISRIESESYRDQDDGMNLMSDDPAHHQERLEAVQTYLKHTARALPKDWEDFE